MDCEYGLRIWTANMDYEYGLRIWSISMDCKYSGKNLILNNLENLCDRP